MSSVVRFRIWPMSPCSTRAALTRILSDFNDVNLSKQCAVVTISLFSRLQSSSLDSAEKEFGIYVKEFVDASR